MPQIAQVDARVPIELVDLIAFHLRPADLTVARSIEPENRLADLISCSLVCHQWRAVVLGHLFFNVTCGFQQEPSEGVVGDRGANAPGDRDANRRCKTISLFCQFLTNTPTVRGCIQQLKLVSRSEVPRERRQCPPEDQLDCQLFARVLRLCPRLDVLHLFGVFLCNVRMPHRSERRSLSALKILPCHRGHYQQLFRPPYKAGADVAPLMFFSSIEHLRLSTPVHGTWMLPSVMTFPSLKVHHLEIEKSGYGLQSLVSALRRSGAVNSIRCLTTTQCNRHRIHPVSPELQRLFALISPALVRVEVRGIFHGKEYVATLPDLSQCFRLRHLYIEFDLDSGSVTETLVRLLRSIPPSAPLERLAMRVVLPKGARALSEDQCAVFHALDEAFAKVIEEHDTLPSVTVKYAVLLDRESPPLELDMRSLFPRLEAKGKLHVRTSSNRGTVR